MNTINIKPLSINEALKGRKYKTEKYNSWRLEMSFKLPKLEVPKGKLKLSLEFGFSSKGSDIDNPVKLTTDSLQLRYGFNDNQIYRLEVDKKIVPKGKEYIKFNLEALEMIRE